MIDLIFGDSDMWLGYTSHNERPIFEPLSSQILEWLIDRSFLALSQPHAMLSYKNAFRLRFRLYNVWHRLREQIIGIYRNIPFLRSMSKKEQNSLPCYHVTSQVYVKLPTWKMHTNMGAAAANWPFSLMTTRRWTRSIKGGGTEAR